jgi:hypothetical protein
MNETCLAYTDPDGVEVCGKPAVGYVRVGTKILVARVPVCGAHKGRHNQGYAKLRTDSKTTVQR